MGSGQSDLVKSKKDPKAALPLFRVVPRKWI